MTLGSLQGVALPKLNPKLKPKTLRSTDLRVLTVGPSAEICRLSIHFQYEEPSRPRLESTNHPDASISVFTSCFTFSGPAGSFGSYIFWPRQHENIYSPHWKEFYASPVSGKRNGTASCFEIVELVAQDLGFSLGLRAYGFGNYRRVSSSLRVLGNSYPPVLESPCPACTVLFRT